ncbi:type ISP restriction/modification enzyme [Candidatus Poribacteria bacterium]
MASDMELFRKLAEVEKVRYVEQDQRVYINSEQYFQGVPSEVWEFRVGGYQVCEKWLKDRKGRQLSYDARITIRELW